MTSTPEPSSPDLDCGVCEDCIERTRSHAESQPSPDETLREVQPAERRANGAERSSLGALERRHGI